MCLFTCWVVGIGLRPMVLALPLFAVLRCIWCVSAFETPLVVFLINLEFARRHDDFAEAPSWCFLSFAVQKKLFRIIYTNNCEAWRIQHVTIFTTKTNISNTYTYDMSYCQF